MEVLFLAPLSQNTYLFQPHLYVVRHQFVPHVTAKILSAAVQTRGETFFCYPGNEHILEAAKPVTWVGIRRNSTVFCRPPPCTRTYLVWGLGILFGEQNITVEKLKILDDLYYQKNIIHPLYNIGMSWLIFCPLFRRLNAGHLFVLTVMLPRRQALKDGV